MTAKPESAVLAVVNVLEIKVRVPATTANLGPGFDCLGVALQIYNRVTIRRSQRESDIPIAMAAGEAFFEIARCESFPFEWSIEGDVPRSRGLGSSVTVRLGILYGLNELSGSGLSREQLFGICARLEGHPDNAAPASFGGFTVAGQNAATARFDVAPSLKFILLIPEFEIATADARKALPDQISRGDAVKSCANACRVTAAFASQKYDLLRGAFEDHLHQPFRQPLIPFLKNVITAGENAGALGGFLSGSGSTICCVAGEENSAENIGAAMLTAANSPNTRIIITQVDNSGARVL